MDAIDSLTDVGRQRELLCVELSVARYQREHERAASLGRRIRLLDGTSPSRRRATKPLAPAPQSPMARIRNSAATRAVTSPKRSSSTVMHDVGLTCDLLATPADGESTAQRENREAFEALRDGTASPGARPDAPRSKPRGGGATGLGMKWLKQKQTAPRPDTEVLSPKGATGLGMKWLKQKQTAPRHGAEPLPPLAAGRSTKRGV
jgi:hypothetical protein